jgi:hypothetical protein
MTGLCFAFNRGSSSDLYLPMSNKQVYCRNVLWTICSTVADCKMRAILDTEAKHPCLMSVYSEAYSQRAAADAIRQSATELTATCGWPNTCAASIVAETVWRGEAGKPGDAALERAASMVSNAQRSEDLQDKGYSFGTMAVSVMGMFMAEGLEADKIVGAWVKGNAQKVAARGDWRGAVMGLAGWSKEGRRAGGTTLVKKHMAGLKVVTERYGLRLFVTLRSIPLLQLPLEQLVAMCSCQRNFRGSRVGLCFLAVPATQ